jgi:acetyl esterase/lipase
MTTRIFFILIAALLLGGTSMAQEKVIRLYQGSAPGSENLNYTEKEMFSTVFNTELVYNVSQPTMQVFLPDPARANGTAVVICPGGAFHILSINSEGNEVARWLNEKGITAFVLKYRLAESKTDDPVKELMPKMGDLKKLDEENAPIVNLAVMDGKTAIAWVRQHAIEFNINPGRIGLMGFSAGAILAITVSYTYSPDNRPDFVAPLYGYLGPVPKVAVPADAPPLFIVAATDDQLGFAKESVKLYTDWISAGKSAELHLYVKGGHGFGMRRQNLPTDHWIDRFGEWLTVTGFLDKAK